jgi:hypothetical protein
MRLRPALPSLPPPPGRPVWLEYATLLLLVAAACLACFKPLSDPDTYWHLALGRQMWQDHALVRSETFSFTDAGAPWEDTEWLFHAAAYPLWRATGDLGLRIVTALLGALGVALAYRPVRLMGGSAAGMAVFLLPTLWSYAGRVRFRPDVVSVLLAVVLCELLIRWYRRTDAGGPERWGVPLLFLFWVQVHGAWTYGVVLLGAFVAGRALDAWRARDLTPVLIRNLLAPAVATALALLLNPYGWRLPLFPLKAFASFRDPAFLRIAEWSRTPFTGMYGVYSAALLATLAAVFLVRRRFSWSEALPAAAQVVLGLYWVRYGAYAVVALVGPAASRLDLLRHRKRMGRVASIAGLLCAAGLLAAQVPAASRSGDLSERYPVHETAFLARELPGGNLLHEYRLGGYLEWVLPRGFKVFMDGRFPLFRAAEVDYYEAHRTPEAFAAFLAKYPFDAALYAYPGFLLTPTSGGPPRGPSAVLFPEKDWALVAFGPYGMVFVKRDPAHAEAAARLAYGVLRPDDLGYLVWASERGTLPREVLIADLERALQQNLSPEVEGALRAARQRLLAQEQPGHAP